MPKSMTAPSKVTPPSQRNLLIKGAKQHNLKNLSVELPRNKLIVFTGPSGSGKSSLAFDTIYAEGQRRYTESLSAYARQFLERMDKPDVETISGLSPAIAIEQKTTSKNPRSTVATTTEIYDHLRLLFARIGRTFSPISNQEVTKDTPRSIALELAHALPDGTRFYLCFALPKHKGHSTQEELSALQQEGFFRIVEIPTEKQKEKGKAITLLDLNETPPENIKVAPHRLYVLVDRLVLRKGNEENENRITDSAETALRHGQGRCTVFTTDNQTVEFSEFFERDGMTFEEPTPHLFSFNSPLGACPECQGFGRVPGLDPNLVVPNPDLTIRQGALAPFRTEKWNTYFRSLLREAANTRFPIDTPYQLLTKEQKDFLWNGYGEFLGITGFFDFLAQNNHKMHYRIYAARFRGYTGCPTCNGYRLRPEVTFVKINGLHIGEISEMTIKDAFTFFNELTLNPYETAVAGRILEEIRKRLHYLNEVGLDYLTLDRLSQTLSGGESQRINLATSLGSALVGSLYVLDEPSIGLHPRDTDRLIRILEHLRDIGNTVIVVEHDAEMMKRADEILDLGPGAGAFGGNIVFQGGYPEILNDATSLTGAYLSKKKNIEIPPKRRAIKPDFALLLQNARENNLKRLDVTFPLGMMVCVTGVSGSGKSTLVHQTLFNGLKRLFEGSTDNVGAHDAIRGHFLINQVEMVDQSPIGRTPRSNPVTYIKTFDDIRQLFASTHQSKIRGYSPGYFSFNVPGGRCEVCQGEGAVKIEMQFLADLYLPCEACHGKRFKMDVLDVRYKDKNIDDVLNMTVSEAVSFFENIPKIYKKLKVLEDVGLGYISLGQPATTLSGGEAQRIKLAAYLARPSKDHTLYIFDEPTTGLHFDDIHKLLKAFNALIDQGHSIILIEHNLDVIKSSDWVIDLGPEGGRAGGYLIAEGTPEALAENPESITGKFLKEVL